MAATRVVNVKHAQPGTFIYVDRAMPAQGFPIGSPLANPYKTREHGLRAGPLFVRDLLAQTGHGARLRELARELRGETLGCWCIEPSWRPGYSHRCHAECIAALADGDLATVEAARSLVWWTTPPAGMAPVKQGDLFGR